MNILYLHGFGSLFDPESEKVQTLKKLGDVYGSDIDWTLPPQKALARSSVIILECRIDLIVGTSMGGWGAAVLGEKFNIPFIAINPAIEPQNTLKRHLGTGIDYHGKPYTLTEQVVNQYYSFIPDGYGLLLVALDDEVIDPSLTINKYSSKYPMTTYRTGGHRFSNLELALPEISAFYDRSLYL